ncbi:hypothetical protein [Candidatus Thiosymbion oneisti]|nr:hypothetical protein [Candidatus Thiosymbion oneisti]
MGVLARSHAPADISFMTLERQDLLRFELWDEETWNGNCND